MSSISRMSSTSHQTVTATSETIIRSSNLRSLPCDGLSNLIHLSSSPTSNSKYLYYVNAEPTQKQTTTSTTAIVSTNSRGKLTGISVTVPWYKRTRSPSDDNNNSKSFQKTPKMSRDRLLPLDKLFTSTNQTVNDDEQLSPTNDFTPLNKSLKLNEKNLQQIKENGSLRHTSSHLTTR